MVSVALFTDVSKEAAVARCTKERSTLVTIAIDNGAAMVRDVCRLVTQMVHVGNVGRLNGNSHVVENSVMELLLCRRIVRLPCGISPDPEPWSLKRDRKLRCAELVFKH